MADIVVIDLEDDLPGGQAEATAAWPFALAGRRREEVAERAAKRRREGESDVVQQLVLMGFARQRVEAAAEWLGGGLDLDLEVLLNTLLGEAAAAQGPAAPRETAASSSSSSPGTSEGPAEIGAMPPSARRWPRQLRNAPPAEASLGRQFAGLERVPALPDDLVRKAQPLFDVCGTGHEPVIFAKNVDGRRGRLIAERVLDDLLRCGHTPPTPRRGHRSGITVELHSNSRSKTPWRTGLRSLSELASQLLAHLQLDADLCERIPALRQRRAWSDTEVLMTTPGCTLGRHTDAQPEGCLLVIFVAGLSCRSQAWPQHRLVERVLESGDAMVFDGTRTAHAVPEVLWHNSFPVECPWLLHRRLAVLVRQSTHA